jgi:hypothetical protein
MTLKLKYSKSFEPSTWVDFLVTANSALNVQRSTPTTININLNDRRYYIGKSPPGFFFLFFNALLIFCFSYDIHLDRLNDHDDGHDDHTPSLTPTPTPPTLQQAPSHPMR